MSETRVWSIGAVILSAETKVCRETLVRLCDNHMLLLK